MDACSGVAENTLALRMKRRKTVSVTPAMGARTVAGATVTLPICTEAGTRVPLGMGCSIGLSQCFFIQIRTSMSGRLFARILVSMAAELCGIDPKALRSNRNIRHR